MEETRKKILAKIQTLESALATKNFQAKTREPSDIRAEIQRLEEQLRRTNLYNGYLFDERDTTMIMNKLTWYQDKAINLHKIRSKQKKLSKNKSSGHNFLPFNINKRKFNLSEVNSHPGVYKMVRNNHNNHTKRSVGYLSHNKTKLIAALKSIYDPRNKKFNALTNAIKRLNVSAVETRNRNIGIV